MKSSDKEDEGVTYPNLHLLLRAANRRVLLVGLCQAVLITISLFLIGLLVALGIDATLALPARGLIALDLGLLGICLLMLGRMIKIARRNRFNSRRVARMLEHRLGITDSSLINSIELREGQRVGVSQRLLQESISKGEHQARRVSIEEAVQMQPARKAGLWATGICGLMVLAYLFAPSVFGRGITRLVDPTGDHPPFTLVEFTVQVTPDPIFHGNPATIQVNLAGPDLPELADLVFLDQSTTQRVPMYSTGPNEYLVSLDRVESSREFFVDTPKGRSERFRLDVVRVPRLESATVTYRYPGYTDWPQDRHDILRRDIRAIAGTEVEIEVTSSMPLSLGRIRLFDNPLESEASSQLDVISLVPDESNPMVARGQTSLQRSSFGRLELIGINESVSPEPLTVRIVVDDDRQPRVEITQPEPVVVAVEDWEIHVTVQAADDVEVSSLDLSMAINGFTAPTAPLMDSNPDPRQATGQYTFHLGELGARPGDLITYYATAFDSHPSGEQFVDTDTYVIQVISKEEYTEYLRRSYRMEQLQAELAELSQELEEQKQQRDELLADMERLQEQIEQGENPSSEQVEEMRELQQKLEDYADKSQQLAEQLQDRLSQPQLYEMEKSYREMLNRVSQQLNQQSDTARQVQQAVSNSSSTPSADNQQAMREAFKQFQQQNAPFDQTTDDQVQQNQEMTDALQKADELMSHAERVKNVIQQQRDLADRMQQFQNSPELSPEQQLRANRLAREQEMLRQELTEAVSALQDAAAESTETLPKTSSDAVKMCQGIQQSGALADQDSAAQSAREGIGEQAHQSAEQAADKLESFLSQCRGMGQGVAGELDSGLALNNDSIRESLRQLSQGRAMPGVKPGQGQQGRGMGGSMSRFALHGPNAPQTGRSESRAGRMKSQQTTGSGRSDAIGDQGRAAESMNVESRFGSNNGSGNLNGVPVGYRDQAEAYFRRLAEESP